MKYPARFLFTCAVLTMVAPAAAYGHFRLLEPASWLIEGERGDPQKACPCGVVDAHNADIPRTNVITKAIGGQKLHIKVQEIVYHPGHYRVALAVNSPDELPPDPEVTTRETEKGPRSVSAIIQNPPQIPVLADGLFVHYTRPTGPMEPFEIDVQLPNINCKKCTLQIVEFMADHAYNNPGGYSYHHCAELEITADPTKPLDKGWPMEHNQMTSGMMDMMHQMQGMMGTMEGMMKNMPPDKMQRMSKMMKNMSQHMMDMSKMMQKGEVSEKEMNSMHDKMMNLQKGMAEKNDK